VSIYSQYLKDASELAALNDVQQRVPGGRSSAAESLSRESSLMERCGQRNCIIQYMT